jgi:26S proteasome regulatory subunit N9
MKALSLGLIKGSLDEVDQTVNVTWVQPKVLDRQQIGIVVSQLSDWSERVKRTLVAVEEQALELYV